MRVEYINIEYLFNCLLLLLKYNKMNRERALLSRKESNQAYLISVVHHIVVVCWLAGRVESQNLSDLWFPADLDNHLEMLLEPKL